MSNKGKSTDNKNNKATTKGKVQRKAPGAKPQAATTEMGALHGPVDNAAQLSATDMQDLQQTYGNRFVQRVSRQTTPSGNNTSPIKATLQRDSKENGAGDVAPEIEGRIQSAQGGGHALPDDLRGNMEQSLGADFSNVNLHTDGEADELNRGLQAEAFTVGSDIFFRKDTYSPGSKEGQGLLAHELTHVVQQGASAPVKEDEPAPTAGSLTSAPTNQDPQAQDKQEEAKNEQNAATNELKTPEQEKEEAAKETRNEVNPEAKKEEKKEGDKQQAEKKKQVKVPGKEAAEQAAGMTASDLESQKFESLEGMDSTSDIGMLLPSWSELAAGTVQLSADPAVEMAAHGESETEEVAPEEIDQAALANDALTSGILAGLQEGTGNLIMGMAMQALSAKVPVADGLMAGASLVSDPEGWWAQEGAVAHFDRFTAIGDAFGAFGDEDTEWGRAAAIFEGVIAIVDFAARLANTISNVLSIIYAVAFPLSFAPFIGPFFTSVVSFISPLLAPLGTFVGYLDVTKMMLQLGAGFLRYMDLRETNADPEQLLKKQANLQSHVKGFVSEAVTQGGQKAKDKVAEKRQDSKLEKADNLPENHPERIRIIEKYDYKGKDTFAEWKARRKTKQDVNNKKIEINAKEKELKDAYVWSEPRLKNELRTLKTEQTTLKSERPQKIKDARARELDKTRNEADASRPEDKKLFDKELRGLEGRSSDAEPGFLERKKASLEHWNMHRTTRGDAAKAGAKARESKGRLKDAESELADNRDMVTIHQRQEQKHGQAYETHRQKRKEHMGQVVEQRKQAKSKGNDAAKYDQDVKHADAKIMAADQKIETLKRQRADMEDSSAIDSQIRTLNRDKRIQLRQKKLAELKAKSARSQAEQHEKVADREIQSMKAAATKERAARNEQMRAVRNRKEAESELKALEKDLKYDDLKTNYERDKKANEQYALTDDQRQRYQQLKDDPDLKQGREKINDPEKLNQYDKNAKELRYLERKRQWEKRTKRTFSGRNTDYWDGKRYTQYRFGGLEFKEWFEQWLTGEELATGKDWAAEYGAAEVYVDAKLYNIQTSDNLSEDEVQTLVDEQQAGKGTAFANYNVNIDPPGEGNDPIDFEGNPEQMALILPGTAKVAAKDKDGAKPTKKWKDAKQVIKKGEKAIISVDYYRVQEDAEATVPILTKADPQLQRKTASLQRQPDEEEAGTSSDITSELPDSAPPAVSAAMEDMDEDIFANDNEQVSESFGEEVYGDHFDPSEEGETDEFAVQNDDELLSEDETEFEESPENEDFDETDSEAESEWPIDPTNGLPIPPYESFDLLSDSAYMHRQLELARMDQEVDQEATAMLAVDAESQSLELAGARGMVVANQTAIDKHNQDIDEKLTAQKDMEQAAGAQKGSAQKGQESSAQGSDLFSSLFAPLMGAMGIGAAHAGTGDQKGSVGQSKEGAGQGAEAGRLGTEMTQSGSELSKQRQTQTLQAQQETKAAEKQLLDLDNNLAEQQDSALEGSEEYVELSEQTSANQDSILEDQTNLSENYLEAQEDVQSWADEHYEVRQQLFDGLETELEE